MNKFKRFCTDIFLALKYFPFDLVRRPNESVYSWLHRFNSISNEQPTLQDFDMNGFAICFRKTEMVTTMHRDNTTDVKHRVIPYTSEEVQDRIIWCNDMFGPENWIVIGNIEQSGNHFPRDCEIFVFSNDDMMLNFRIAFGEK